MSISARLNGSPRVVASEGSAAVSFVWGLPFAVAAGCLLALAMTLPKAWAVWKTGIFFDPDDAMRAVEVRDFLAGQGWFDLVQHRLSPDHPFLMHWSRLADLPLAAAVRLLQRFAGPETAERITRLFEPQLFLVGFLTAFGSLARDLAGRRGPLAFALLAAGALEIVGNFIPGHIHHHAVQLMLLGATAKFFCDGLDPARASRMGWAGASAVLSLAINLQNLPFLMAAAAVLGLLWAAHGAMFDRAVRAFGLGLLLAVPAFLLQIPPARYFEASCDTFAAPHLLATAAASVSFVALATFSGRFRSMRARLAGLAVAAVAITVLMTFAYPACLGDPYAAVDPLVRRGWMSEVGEAMPLARLLSRDPWGTIPIVAALGLGLGCAVQALRREQGLARTRWIAIAAFGMVGVVGTVWQVRVASSAEAFACLGATWWLCRTFGPGSASRRFATLLCVLAGLGSSQAGWTSVLSLPQVVLSSPTRSMGWLPRVDPDRCFAPASYATLRRLPQGLVLSTVDSGAHILAYTGHQVLAGPYHRDTYGIRLAVQVFELPPEEARGLILESGARYVMLCTTSPETHEIVARSPDGFASQILTAHPPPWLEALPADSGPLRIFEVVSDLRR